MGDTISTIQLDFFEGNLPFLNLALVIMISLWNIWDIISEIIISLIFSKGQFFNFKKQ